MTGKWRNEVQLVRDLLTAINTWHKSCEEFPIYEREYSGEQNNRVGAAARDMLTHLVRLGQAAYEAHDVLLQWLNQRLAEDTDASEDDSEEIIDDLA